MVHKKKSYRLLYHTLLTVFILFLGIIGSLTALTFAYDYTHDVLLSEKARESNSDISEMTFEITSSTTIKELATFLEEQHFISNAPYFRLEAMLNKIKEPLPMGTYSITSNLSTKDLLKKITYSTDEAISTVEFTIPEGFTIVQIAEHLEQEGIVDKKTFLSAANNRHYSYDFLEDISDDTNYTLEGYLFPDTYIISETASSEEIITLMLNRFEDIIMKYEHYIDISNYNLHEMITVASIIEEEAQLDEERSIISGVIYNRLATNMPLQMCSSIQYLLEKRKANLSYDDLKVDSPYNTYINEGLPPGPISCPGEASIKAAFSPETHDYYYFVVKDSIEGSHSFSRTAAEHLASKTKYQQGIDKNFSN